MHGCFAGGKEHMRIRVLIRDYVRALLSLVDVCVPFSSLSVSLHLSGKVGGPAYHVSIYF